MGDIARRKASMTNTPNVGNSPNHSPNRYKFAQQTLQLNVPITEEELQEDHFERRLRGIKKVTKGN